MDTPFITRVGEGVTFTTSPTDEMTFLCEGDQHMPDVMIERLGQGDGPPLHSHPWGGWSVVIRGRVRFHIDGENYDLEPGSFAYTPPDAVHSFMAISEDGAEIVDFQWPGGFHIAYADIAEEFSSGQPDFENLARIAGSHQITLHGPPLAVLEAGD